MWYDFGTVLPGPGVLVRARRFPQNTPPLWGTFDVPTATLSTQLPDGRTIATPWAYLTHWFPLTGTPPQWPAPPPTAKSWRDPFFTRPQDGAHLWLRRFDADSALVRATYSKPGNSFLISDTPGWRLEWYQVCKWKPA